MADDIVFTALKSFHWNPLEPVVAGVSYSFRAGEEYTLPGTVAGAVGWQPLILDGYVSVISGYPAAFTQIKIDEITAPVAPTSGCILYVDSGTHNLMALFSSGSAVLIGTHP